MKIIRQLFTDSQDNWELASILGFLVFCVFIYLSIHAYVMLKQTFDPQAFGVGAGGLATGIGAHKFMGNKGDNQ